jgi:Secretion system C-terminal sorting domain
MKRIIRLIFLFFLWPLCNSAQAPQLQYLGLKKEGNVRVAQKELQNICLYWPKSHVIDNYIYVPTLNGIYRKDLRALNDTVWSLYAFPGVPIRDFVKHNDSILAIAMKAQDSIMLLSADNGKTYVNHTSGFLLNKDNSNLIGLIAMNPLNHNSIVIWRVGAGVEKSMDFGNTWSVLNPSIGGYQNRFAGFNPNDTTNIFITGEFMIFESFIYSSYDSGNSWELVESIPNHCTHILAFHPTNPDIIMSGGEYRIAKSTDRGLSWKTDSYHGIYVTGLIYDTDNPNILYASGDIVSPNAKEIQIFKSTDGGDSWSLFYTEEIENSDGVLDIHLYKNKLIIYTLVSGVYSLDLKTTSVINPKENKIDLTVYQNPSNSTFLCKSSELFDYVRLMDSSGRILKEYKPDSKEFSIDISSFSSGIYLLQLWNDNGNYSKKVIIR